MTDKPTPSPYEFETTIPTLNWDKPTQYKDFEEWRNATRPAISYKDVDALDAWHARDLEVKALREKVNTLEWALKQFVTRDHTELRTECLCDGCEDARAAQGVPCAALTEKRTSCPMKRRWYRTIRPARPR